MNTLNEIREVLELHFEGTYRKVWLQKSARANDVILTLFLPNYAGYTIRVLRGLREITYQEIVDRLG
jgi:hypothetical protein